MFIRAYFIIIITEFFSISLDTVTALYFYQKDILYHEAYQYPCSPSYFLSFFFISFLKMCRWV